MQIVQLGEVDYQTAWKLQRETVDKRLNGRANDTLIVCSHPPVVTLGKKSNPQDLKGWSGDIYRIERGGKATYHGPEQVIVYPIVDLKSKGQNIAGFLEAMESAMVNTLSHYHLTASGNPNRGQPDFTGVWVESKKVASIGVAIKKWVTYHGLALNLYSNPKAFQGISPCGLRAENMVSIEELKNGEKVPRHELETYLIKYLSQGIQNLFPDGL